MPIKTSQRSVKTPAPRRRRAQEFQRPLHHGRCRPSSPYATRPSKCCWCSARMTRRSRSPVRGPCQAASSMSTSTTTYSRVPDASSWRKPAWPAPTSNNSGAGAARHGIPRGWSATHAYFALVQSLDGLLATGANAADVAWFEVDALLGRAELAFDHGQILRAAVERLRSKVEYTSLPAFLLPEPFTLPQLQRAYEIVLGRTRRQERISDPNAGCRLPGRSGGRREQLEPSAFGIPVEGHIRPGNLPAHVQSARLCLSNRTQYNAVSTPSLRPVPFEPTAPTGAVSLLPRRSNPGPS